MYYQYIVWNHMISIKIKIWKKKKKIKIPLLWKNFLLNITINEIAINIYSINSTN